MSRNSCDREGAYNGLARISYSFSQYPAIVTQKMREFSSISEHSRIRARFTLVDSRILRGQP
jgi:hypothetical protein